MVKYIRVQENTDCIEKYRDEFISLYTAIYSQSPYFEKFSKIDVENSYKDYIAHDAIMFFVIDNNSLIGFAAGVPLVNKDKSTVDLVAKYVPLEYTFYNAEVVVNKKYRNQGIGGELIDLRLLNIKDKGYKYVVMRTAKNGSMSAGLYRKRGFIELPVVQLVKQERVLIGFPDVDERVFFYKNII